PALRLDWMRTVPIADSAQPIEDEAELMARSDLFLSPRVAWRARIARGLAGKGSVGRYFRAPTAVELFGDRGFVVGNPSLVAETGLSGDIGLVWAPPGAFGQLPGATGAVVDRVHIEAALFTRRPRDTIAFSSAAGGLVLRAQNRGDARIQGVEIGAALRLARTATVSGNYTLLDTRQVSDNPSYDGKPLPHRPRHSLYGRVDIARALGPWLAVMWGDFTFTTGNFLDSASLFEVPARRLLGAGLKLEPAPGLAIGIEAKNLLDERIESIELDPAPRPDLQQVPRAVADFFGYPLPGRALYLTVQWDR
ncbi:MAG: TonB-dependent receptor, partial [Myxococcota bacterium]